MNTEGLKITDLPLKITDLPLKITDLPLEILCGILIYSDTPLNYANISLVCRHFYNANKMLKETKAQQFSRKMTFYINETRDREGIYHGSIIYYLELPNNMLHGKYLTCSYTRGIYQNLWTFSEIKCDIYVWGVLVISYTITIFDLELSKSTEDIQLYKLFKSNCY
jgi:hypothetical protein